MNFSKLSFEETLLEKVVLKDICMGCGACVLVCPYTCLEYLEEKPSLVKKCEVCGICPQVCPLLDFSQPVLEKLVFDRERKPEEDFGVYRNLVVAKATDANVLKTCQDGGVVSTLLIYAMKNGLIDGAIISAVSREKPFLPVASLASNPQQVLECAGTRYTYSPNILAFQEAIKQKRKSLAFVGTPCQIQAIRKIESAQLKKYSNMLRFTIGLMCTESFTYEGLMEKHIQGVLGIKLKDVQKINIKGKVLVAAKSGEAKSIPLTEAKQYVRRGCIPCTDFSAELADISAGGLGLDGWTFAILRTKVGEELFTSVEEAGLIKTRPVEEEKNAFNLLIKMSKRKRKS